jgi:hypothetical protein
MYKYKPINTFSIYEGVYEGVYEGLTTIPNAYTDFSANYMDISNDFGNYERIVSELKNNNNIYHYDDKIDANIIFEKNKSKDIKTAINNDINEIQLYQNSIYITGIIACATLLIASIIISKK